MEFYECDGHVTVTKGLQEVAQFDYADKGDHVFVSNLEAFSKEHAPYVLFAIAAEFEGKQIRFLVDADDDETFARLLMTYVKRGAKLEGFLMSYGGN